jgi:putative membrane protein
MMWGWGPGWWILGSLLTVVFWVAVIVLIVTLVRGHSASEPSTGRSMTPALRILEERYARGEISREEFMERRAVLAGGGPPPPPPGGAPPSDPREPTQPI